jgi:uncharacterized membrane protein YdjX (TVP38/TMEM64 family)
MEESHSPPAETPSWRLRLVQVLTVLIIVAASAATLYYRDRVQELAEYGYVAIFLVGLISNATVILPIPGLAVSSLLGGVFNPWLVGLVGGVGQALGELSGYMVGYSGHELVDENPTYDRLVGWMDRHGVTTVFVLAVIPNPLFDLGGAAAGALRMPVWKFLLSCTAGKVVKNIVLAFVGYFGAETMLRLLGGG